MFQPLLDSGVYFPKKKYKMAVGGAQGPETLKPLKPFSPFSRRTESDSSNSP